MRLERALVTGAGGVLLPASKKGVLPVHGHLLALGLWGIPSGDTVALSSEVVSRLRCRRDGRCRSATLARLLCVSHGRHAHRPRGHQFQLEPAAQIGKASWRFRKV